MPITPRHLYRKILDEQNIGFKYLLIYRNKEDMVAALDGKIYAISDTDGSHLCDILHEDYIRMTEDLTLIDSLSAPQGIAYFSDWVIANPQYRETVLACRLSILFLEREPELSECPDKSDWPYPDMPQEFYQKEFVCGNSSITRGELEELPCPFFTAEVTDEQMQAIIDETDAETKLCWRLPTNRPINFGNNRYSETWWKELECAANRHHVPYYEDISLAYHGTPDPNVEFSTDGRRVIYFTDDHAKAEQFARAEGRGGLFPGETATVIHTRITLRNPYVVQTEQKWLQMADDTVIDKAELSAKGYDGILYCDENNVNTYVVFNSSDCKIIQKETLQ
ncbi:hypothetical protein I180019D1_20000 [Alistipes sp. i18-0019-D1]